MSQMKPYCFKCGAELDPDAIYCPECGRLQRSMVVRAVEPGGSGVAAAPPEQPYQLYPGQQAEPGPQTEHLPDQPQYPHDPYAEQQQYADQGWYAGEQPAAHAEHDQHADAAYPHDSWEAQPGQYPEVPEHDGGQVHAEPGHPEQAHPDTWSQAGQDPYAQGYEQQPGYAPPGYAPHEDPVPGYEPQYGHHPQPEHEQYAHQEPDREQAAAQHGQPEQSGYEEPAYGQAESAYGHSEPGYRQVEPAYQASEPVYTSSAPIPSGGGYQPRPPAPYTSEVNPYGPPPSEYAPPVPGPSRARLYALLAAGLLGLILVGFTIGQIMSRGGPSSPSAAAPPQRTAAPAPSSQPSTAPTVAPTPTSGQGAGNARFQKVTADIPGGHCTTAQGCPITVTLKNSGDTGSGTVTVTLTDDGGNPVGTFTGPIPSTDAGATVQVSGFATGSQLPTYLRNGGIVHITTVDVKNG